MVNLILCGLFFSYHDLKQLLRKKWLLKPIMGQSLPVRMTRTHPAKHGGVRFRPWLCRPMSVDFEQLPHLFLTWLSCLWKDNHKLKVPLVKTGGLSTVKC